MINIAKIAKCLALSQSSNDAEALAAVRKANQLLNSEQLTWQGFLADMGLLRTDGPIRSETGAIDWAEVIDGIIERKPYLKVHWIELLHSIKDHYERTGRLSDKQKGVVRGFQR
jgi:Protein of unknown function (DUF2786)